MGRYETVIGLEVHAQLATRSKLFCSCSNHFGDAPNVNVCAVCSGMPGVLPVLNEKAVDYACMMALAIDCTINERSIFARKNYFYPDLPKGYQISQFETPLAEHGKVRITVNGQQKTIGVTRIHIEDDAGKNIHSQTENESRVDLNRSGTPLIEIVSDPDLRCAEEAVAYLKELRAILIYLGICDGNMEEGSFRCDANVSLRPVGQAAFGTRAELKNMNSFRHVQKAIEYEVSRQADLLGDGEKVVQETRLYDADKGVTASMRGKEEAHDYRYFPDPDLPPIFVAAGKLAALRAGLPELPRTKRERFISDYDIPTQDADVLTLEKDLADYFEVTAKACGKPKKAANWIMAELLRELHQHDRAVTDPEIISPENLAELIDLIDSGVISGKIAKQIFPDLFLSGKAVTEFIKAKGLAQISDTSELEAAIDAVLAESPAEVAAYKGGKTKLVGFFVGQIMKKTRGQANPGLVNELLAKKLA